MTKLPHCAHYSIIIVIIFIVIVIVIVIIIDVILISLLSKWIIIIKINVFEKNLCTFRINKRRRFT